MFTSHQQLRLQLQDKSFTTPNHDRPAVAVLYEKAFTKRMGEAETLYFEMLGWGDEEMATLSRVIAAGHLPSLKTLSLDNNQRIGDAGVSALADAVAEGGLAQLTTLGLRDNQVGDSGMQALAAAVAGGALPSLEHVGLARNPGNAEPVYKVLHSCRRERGGK